MPLKLAHKTREADNKGRFRSPKQEETEPVIPLSKEVMDPLIGNLLGDGSLLFPYITT